MAYLGFVPASRLAHRPLPASWPPLPLAIGRQFPDLVDNPLADYDILTYGRSFAHSLFTWLAITGVLWALTTRYRGQWPASDCRERLRRSSPFAVTIGYVTHLVAEAWRPLANGNASGARWLLWPIYSLPESAPTRSPPGPDS